MAATVYLVGAGPGDPGLLTVRALELLRTADVVAHDRLITPQILALANPLAELLDVGHRRGDATRTPCLHPAVAAHAREGKVVVRLKAGDPFVFGRGGEEADELRALGIAYEVVPGVSAAFGAAATTGIPLTHREVSSRILLATGHLGSAPPGAGAPGDGTLVLYMAAARLESCLAALARDGAGGIPAAYVSRATTPRQRVVVATVATLADQVAPERDDVGIVIVGHVVRLRERLRWFEHRPLLGRRILVGRSRHGSSEIARQLGEQGADVVEAPLSRVVAVELEGLRALGSDRRPAILASIPAVGCVVQALRRGVVSAEEVTDRMLVAADRRTASSMLEHDLIPSLCLGGRDPSIARCRELLGSNVYLVGSSTMPEGLPRALREGGIEVSRIHVHQEELSMPELADPSLLVFPSSTTATQVLGAAPQLRDVPCLVMGPRTEAAAREAGAVRVMRAPEPGIASMVAAVVAFFR